MIESESTPAVEQTPTSATESAPSAPSTSPDSSSVGAEVDAMFGYRAPVASREAPDDEDAGAPLAPSSESTTVQPETAGAPPVAGQTTNESVPTDDPLKGATALSYTVSGQERSEDRIKVVKDLGGAFIDSADLPHIQQRLSERDHLHERSQEQNTRLQALEKLTEWQTQDANGNATTLTGRDAIEAQRLVMGNALSEMHAYRDLFNDPNKLAEFLQIKEDQSGFEFRPDMLRAFKAELENRQLKLGADVRRWVSNLPQTNTPPAAPSAPIDPTVLASTAVDRAIATGIAGLTDVDKQWAKGIAPRYIHVATAKDVAENPGLRVGSPFVEPEFVALLQERASLRAESAKQVTAASTAATANAPKLAAALAGRNAPRPVVARQPAPPQDDDLSPEEHAYLRREAAAGRALQASVR